MIRFQQCLTRAMTLIKMYFVSTIRKITLDTAEKMIGKVSFGISFGFSPANSRLITSNLCSGVIRHCLERTALSKIPIPFLFTPNPLDRTRETSRIRPQRIRSAPLRMFPSLVHCSITTLESRVGRRSKEDGTESDRVDQVGESGL